MLGGGEEAVAALGVVAEDEDAKDAKDGGGVAKRRRVLERD